MESSKIKEFEKICKIAYNKIPVSEESSVFNLFSARREIARRLKDDNYNEEQKSYILLEFEKINDLIKQYFLL